MSTSDDRNKSREREKEKKDRKCCDEIRKREGETNVNVDGSWSNGRDKAYLIGANFRSRATRALVGNETRALKSQRRVVSRRDASRYVSILFLSLSKNKSNESERERERRLNGNFST